MYLCCGKECHSENGTSRSYLEEKGISLRRACMLWQGHMGLIVKYEILI